ncbi:MAG: proteasome accessory factor PafA2 family protein [Verrucomicrobiales bacterium]|nr:proteasome accessory factor PafA2 family protein [Verrucomicrobiales bacterium]
MPTPHAFFGIETEFGIARGDRPDLDVVAESIALVRSATEPGILMRWDYAAENPHRDMRGFEVEELRQDFDEARYVSQDSQRALSFTEIKSDLVFGNGARFYNDHAHPEYCTPECARFEDAVVHDRAGERLVMACAAELTRQRGETVRVYKNNTDFCGHSYGCHENYLVPRALEWQSLANAIQGFLVTRQIFAGAGKFAVEEEDRFVSHGFQIAQRSDFFSELQSVDTMQRRPIINTRDEPHADPLRWRRFHVILGDANMMPFATWLKIGTTALVLEAIALAPRDPWPTLAAPLDALRSISRDPSFQWPVRLAQGAASSALEVQAACLQQVRRRCDLSLPHRALLVEAWDEILRDLDHDPLTCADRLDWVAKRQWIRQFQESEGIADEDPWLRSLDLEYHRLDPAEGLFFALEQSGAVRPLPLPDCGPAAIERAMHEPPSDTRAAVRGLCVSKFGAAVENAQWDHVTLRTSRGPLRLDLASLIDPAEVHACLQALRQVSSPDDLRFPASA